MTVISHAVKRQVLDPHGSRPWCMWWAGQLILDDPTAAGFRLKIPYSRKPLGPRRARVVT